MTDLFQQLGGALTDFKMRNIDSDSLHEIIGEFAPLIGVATDSLFVRKAPKSEPEECKTAPEKKSKENEIDSLKSDIGQKDEIVEIKTEIVDVKSEAVEIFYNDALDLSMKLTAKSEKENIDRPVLKRCLETAVKTEADPVNDQPADKKAKHSLDMAEMESEIIVNPEGVQDDSFDEESSDLSNNSLYELRTVNNLKYYQCKQCPKFYDTKYLINRHLITHGRNKPFACDQCNKSFSQKCDLNRHMMVHSGTRQYACSVCGKSFKRNDYLMKHERQFCGTQKPHKCQKCHKGFEDPSLLLDHTCSARNCGSSFECEHCSESFTTVDALVEHRKGHLNTNTEYTCTRCHEQFGEFISYVEHFKVKT